MRRIGLFLAFVIIISIGMVAAAEPSPGSDGLGDPFDPNLGNGGYDVQHYALDIDVDMDTNTIYGVATLDVIAMQDLSSFNLDLRGLEISSIWVNDQPVSFERDGVELTITPLMPILANDAFTVAVAYSGVPESSSDQLANIGWIRYTTGVYVTSEPSGASTWYPVNDHPLDKATYSFMITVPKPYVVAANGLLKDEIDNGATVTYMWESAHPMASYLATVAIADFIIDTEEGPDGLPIRNYIQAGLVGIVDDQYENTAEMIEYFSTIFGPYPFEAYGNMYVEWDLGFVALETQTLSTFGLKMLEPRPGGPENVVAHELVHQWFGDSVSLTRWEDIWLNEGFATYGSFLWVEHLFGRNTLNQIMDDQYNAIKEMNYHPGDPLQDGNLFNQGVYLQGAWTLHALRLEVGDDAFFDILRTYAERYRYGNVTTEDFIAVAEEISGQDLDALFDAWLYAGGVPPKPAG